ncbi:MAG: fibronectin type III domain-containing protein [Clostridia bacterium]|nr:fibronectin type III domain-containing protein [Clostridia bacterium]
MKAMNTIKRWMLRSVLFLGISLSICAVVKLTIKSIVVHDIESTRAKLNVEFTGADGILVHLKTATETEYTLLRTIDTEETDLTMSGTINGLIPDTQYNVKVEVVTDLSDLDNTERVESEISFKTQVAEP